MNIIFAKVTKNRIHISYEPMEKKKRDRADGILEYSNQTRGIL